MFRSCGHLIHVAAEIKTCRALGDLLSSILTSAKSCLQGKLQELSSGAVPAGDWEPLTISGQSGPSIEDSGAEILASSVPCPHESQHRPAVAPFPLNKLVEHFAQSEQGRRQSHRTGFSESLNRNPFS